MYNRALGYDSRKIYNSYSYLVKFNISESICIIFSYYFSSSSGIGLSAQTLTSASASVSTGKGGGPVSRAVNAELLASLSSSRCMLKRRRHDTDSESEDDDDDGPATPKATVYSIFYLVTGFLKLFLSETKERSN